MISRGRVPSSRAAMAAVQRQRALMARLTRPGPYGHKAYCPGDVVGLEPSFARDLVEFGLAEPIEQEVAA